MLLLVSGSPHPASANSRLLLGIGKLAGDGFLLADYLPDLPVFQPDRDRAPWPASVLRWRADVAKARAVVISTPAYLHNVPGVLKNALEWLTSSGEFAAKPTLVLTFTPAPPRGDRARTSLLWSLDALNARVVAEQALYQSEIKLSEEHDVSPGDMRDLLTEALSLL
jgi:NAD(P)H-dependent FMN reductase